MKKTDANAGNEIIFELQDRIDKAIEELELWKPKNKVIKTEIDYLLEILRGEE